MSNIQKVNENPLVHQQGIDAETWETTEDIFNGNQDIRTADEWGIKVDNVKGKVTGWFTNGPKGE